VLRFHNITEVAFPRDDEWSEEVHEHLLELVRKELQGRMVPMGQAEVRARHLVDQEIARLTAEGTISFANGRWVFARPAAKVVQLFG